MKTIIAATDFSETANHAVRFAADLSCVLKTRLIIFNAVTVDPVATDALVSVDFYEAAEEQADKLLQELVLEMKRRTKNEIVIESVCKVGTVVNQLEALCEEEDTLAIFIASEFVTAFDRFLWGSHAIPIAKHSAYPVVVVPAKARMNDFKKIGIAIDLAGGHSIPWQVLRDWLRPFNAEVDVVAVSSGGELSSKEVPLTIDVQEQLGSFKVHYFFLANDDAEEGIRNYVAENDPDLLIMFVQKHGLFHRSVTKPFILLPPVPVMFISTEVR